MVGMVGALGVVAGTAAEEAGGQLEEAWASRPRDPAGTLQLAESLRDEARRRADDLALARALTLIAACHLSLNDYPAGLRSGLEALALLEHGPLPERARALAEVGYLEVMHGETAAGIERLSESLRIHDELGDRRQQALALNRIGVAFFDHGDLDDAEHAYRRSLGILLAEGEAVEAAGVENNLAKVLTARGDHDAALTHLRAARRGFDAAGERRGLGMTFHNAAVVSEAQGALDRAEEQLRTSIEHYAAAGHPHGACESRSRLGRLLGRRGRAEEAMPLLHRAHTDAESLGVAGECVRAAEALADLLEAQGDAAGALRWLRHLRAVERAMSDEVSEQRLRGLQVRFQLERLHRDSVTDPLTGLRNRRGFDDELAVAAERARAAGEELALLLFDLDDFKRINDTFSHSTGDEVLRTVAERLRAGTRPTDTCVRFGGEEFVVVLPGCDLARASAVGDDLRVAIRTGAWSELAEGLVVTASVGAAVLSSVPDAASLLLAADRAMYEAKHEGKDQVRA
jgi:diguanylate cyclase (GGDEF)-like protein